MTTRRLRIEWAPGSKVTGLLSGAGEGKRCVLLAHGAGAGQRHPFMAGMRRRLAPHVSTLTFDYPYVEAGRRSPDRLERLVECHAAAHRRAEERFEEVVVAGKSMGGRVGGHLVTEREARSSGLLFLGYPLIPLGSKEPRDTSHLDAYAEPVLFVQGERDRLGPPEQIGAVARRMARAALHVVPGADHGFRVPSRIGSTDEVLDALTRVALDFLASL